MRGKTHCTIGVLSVIQASILFKIPITVFSLMLSAFFSILPDLDESNSVISDILLNKNTSKLLFKFVVYMISLTIFFISLKLNNNFYYTFQEFYLWPFLIESRTKRISTAHPIGNFVFFLILLPLVLRKHIVLCAPI